MSARHKNKHRSRNRTHAVKPANLSHRSLEKKAPPPAASAPAPGDHSWAMPAASHATKQTA